MTTYDELTPDALFLLENLSELDIVQDCADRGAKIAELREELVQQRERADNAAPRLDLATQALIADGYFTRAEVGDEGSPDIAPRITELAVHLRAELAAFHEGEEPYDDDRLIPTPGQWIWRWNRATPAERLGVVQVIKTLGGQRDRVESLARSWADAPPLIPGQALADLRNALSDDPQPTYVQAVQAGDRLIRVTGTRVPTPDERAAIGALLDANEDALGQKQPATGGIYGALHKAVAETVTPPAVGKTVDCGPQPLMARVLGVAAWPCESGRHPDHPMNTCEEYDALVELRKCKVIVPHPFQQATGEDVGVCRCTKWPKHHIHTGDRAVCACEECCPVPYEYLPRTKEQS
jgi:hypothetical protein